MDMPTDRRRDDARLRESEQRLHAVMSSAPVILFALDASGIFTLSEGKGLEALGMTPGAVVGRSVFDVYRNEPGLLEHARRALAGDVLTVVDELRGVTFETRWMPLSDEQGIVTGVTGVATDITERRRSEDERAAILAREQVALTEATARAGQIEATFEALADGMIVYDGDGRVVRMNGAARRLLDLDEGPIDYAARSLEERAVAYDLRDEHGHPFGADEWPLTRILRGEVLQGADATDILLRTRAGREVQVSIGGAPVRDGDGQVVGAVTILYDVTERRRLERRTHEALDALLAMARALVQSSAGADGAAGEQGAGQKERVGETASGVARELAELTRSVLGCARVAIIAVDPETRAQRRVAAVGLSAAQEQEWWATAGAARGADPAEATLTARLLAGEVLVLDMEEPPFRDRPNPFGIRTALIAPLHSGDRFSGLLALDHGDVPHEYTRDEVALAGAVAALTALVIERERLLRDAAEARAQGLALREANRRMDEFLSIASHELKTPLTSIKGNIQVARRRLRRLAGDADDVGDRREDLAGAIEEIDSLLGRSNSQIGRMDGLVNDLLDVSRMEQGSLEVRPILHDLVPIVRDIVEEQRGLWPAREITVESRVESGVERQEDDDLAVSVRVDPDRIAQVLTNFLTNALKYSADDRPVRVAIARQGPEVYVRVRDEGPGLTAEEQGRLWGRFHRVHGVVVRSGAHGATGGIGLGLYISRMIVERHHGRVGVDSARGVGSTFYFCLPLVDSR